MTQKSFIALVLTGLFLINLTVIHLGGLVQLVSGEEVVITSSYCTKSSSVKTGGETEMIIGTTTNPSIEIPGICNSYFDVKDESFSVSHMVEDNYRTYTFNDELYSDLFSLQLYIPPRV